MEVKAQLRNFRTSSQKIRLATHFVRGKSVAVAEAQLQFSPRGAAAPILKLLRSAIANAEKNHQLEKANLFVKDIVITEGATLKRFRPRAFGRAATIRKRTAHVTMVLAERPVKGKTSTKAAAPAIEPTPAKVEQAAAKPSKAKSSSKKISSPDT